jgi:hypothetical protein
MNRIWIYQSKYKLSPSAKESISSEISAFITRWAAHKVKLEARFEILYDHFIILSVNEAEVLASGCSIDDSVRFMQELDRQYNLSLFDRLQMAYLDADKEVKVCSFNEIDKLYESGEIKDDTLVFDNTIINSEQLSNSWKVPFAESGFVVLK